MFDSNMTLRLIGGGMGLTVGLLFLRLFLRHKKRTSSNRYGWIGSSPDLLDSNTRENMEALISDIIRNLRVLARSPHPVVVDRVKGLLRDLQRRLRLADEKVAHGFEMKALRLFEDAARLGITVSPENVDLSTSTVRDTAMRTKGAQRVQ